MVLGLQPCGFNHVLILEEEATCSISKGNTETTRKQ
jgi:hypothetical protein